MSLRSIGFGNLAVGVQGHGVNDHARAGHLQRWVEALSGQARAAANFKSLIGMTHPPDEAARLRQGLDHQTEKMQRYVAALAAKYRRATAKMDNGHVETYLRYRIIGPFIRR